MVDITFEERKKVIYMRIGNLGAFRLDQVINTVFIAPDYNSLILKARDQAVVDKNEDVRQTLNGILIDVRKMTDERGLLPVNEISVDFNLKKLQKSRDSR